MHCLRRRAFELAEWQTEEGIGETRSLLIDGDRVLAAKLHWPGELRAGEVVETKLSSKSAGSSRGVAQSANGTEILVDQLPASVAEGSQIPVRITRAPIAERGRYKRAHGRVTSSPDDQREPAGRTVRNFPPGQWEEVWHAAAAGTLEFTGGSLIFSGPRLGPLPASGTTAAQVGHGTIDLTFGDVPLAPGQYHVCVRMGAAGRSRMACDGSSQKALRFRGERRE